MSQTLAAAIDSAEERKLKHIDLRHSRIPEAGKKVQALNHSNHSDQAIKSSKPRPFNIIGQIKSKVWIIFALKYFLCRWWMRFVGSIRLTWRFGEGGFLEMDWIRWNGLNFWISWAHQNRLNGLWLVENFVLYSVMEDKRTGLRKYVLNFML